MLIQVSGTKKVVFFEPNDVDKLYMKGDKSEVLDIDNPDFEKYPLFSTVKRYECQLESGDVLFIPGNIASDCPKDKLHLFQFFKHYGFIM